MFVTISYINLFILLTVSICQIILSIIYHGQCPASPYLPTTLIITGILGVILSIGIVLIHRFDTSDGPNRWNLLLTYILFIYLIGSRIATSIMTFRLISHSYDVYQCAAVLYWSSTLLIILSYSIIVITCCILIKLIFIEKNHDHYQKTILIV